MLTLVIISDNNIPSTVIIFSFFFFNDTATTEIYTLSLHDALPIYVCGLTHANLRQIYNVWALDLDRKSTRLNSSHVRISYAVFCLKKKKKLDNNYFIKKKKKENKKEITIKTNT